MRSKDGKAMVVSEEIETMIKKLLLAMFTAPARALSALNREVDKSLNPPRDYVGMCRCGEKLVSDVEKNAGECCHCLSRWAV